MTNTALNKATFPLPIPKPTRCAMPAVSGSRGVRGDSAVRSDDDSAKGALVQSAQLIHTLEMTCPW